MPNSATLSIYGLYQADSSLFEYMSIPDSVDGDLLIDNIVIECSEIEILYPDAEFMKIAIGIWSAKELSTWERLAELSDLQYNPIENYDRFESETTGRDRSKTTTGSEKTSSASHSQQNNEETSSSVSNSAHNVTGYNTNTPVTDSADNDTSAGGRSESVTGNAGSSSELTRDGAEDEQENLVRSSHIHGNVGVKSAQQMQAESLELIPKLNIINYITESFKKRFCILVY